jgi:hypothetical protein
LEYFTNILYVLLYVFPLLVCCTKKNPATLVKGLTLAVLDVANLFPDVLVQLMRQILSEPLLQLRRSGHLLRPPGVDCSDQFRTKFTEKVIGVKSKSMVLAFWCIYTG